MSTSATFPTLRVLAHAVNGLYFEEHTGRRFRREELLEAFPASVLDSHAHLTRVAEGLYTLDLSGTAALSFRLHSRRREPRDDHDLETSQRNS